MKRIRYIGLFIDRHVCVSHPFLLHYLTPGMTIFKTCPQQGLTLFFMPCVAALLFEGSSTYHPFVTPDQSPTNALFAPARWLLVPPPPSSLLLWGKWAHKWTVRQLGMDLNRIPGHPASTRDKFQVTVLQLLFLRFKNGICRCNLKHHSINLLITKQITLTCYIFIYLLAVLHYC